jgi:hypothetical protein
MRFRCRGDFGGAVEHGQNGISFSLQAYVLLPDGTQFITKRAAPPA